MTGYQVACSAELLHALSTLQRASTFVRIVLTSIGCRAAVWLIFVQAQLVRLCYVAHATLQETVAHNACAFR